MLRYLCYGLGLWVDLIDNTDVYLLRLAYSLGVRMLL